MVKNIFEWFVVFGYVISILGFIIGFFFNISYYFVLVFLFFLMLSGMFQKQTLNIFFMFSTSFFAKFWAVAYLIIIAIFMYVFYLGSIYEEPKTIIELFFGTDIQNELKEILEFFKIFIYFIIGIAIIELLIVKEGKIKI